MIIAMVSFAILYASVSKIQFDPAWVFLCAVLKNQNILDLKYSNEDQKIIDQSDPLTAKWRYICSGAMVFLSMPFLYQRSLSSLRFVSLTIVLVISYTVIVSLIEFPMFLNFMLEEKHRQDYEVEWFSKKPDMSWFQGMATMMLSYHSQILFFFVRGEMMSKSTPRIKKLVFRLTIALGIFFILFSTIGYASVGDKYMPELFTLRKNLGRDLLI